MIAVAIVAVALEAGWIVQRLTGSQELGGDAVVVVGLAGLTLYSWLIRRMGYGATAGQVRFRHHSPFDWF